MSIARYVRRVLPLRWQPPVRYHYERWRGLTEREMGLVCGAVGPGDRVADIGASHGVYTYAFARRGAMVEAFEPQAGCAEVLAAFAAAVPSVRIHRVALGAAPGAGRLVTPGGNRGPETRVRGADALPDPTTVRVVPLDAMELGPLALLKIDVEGSEMEVLRGARRTLDRDRPLLFVEIEQRHLARPIEEVFDFVRSLGYVIHFLDRAGRPRPVREFDLGRDQHVAAIGQPGQVYINNFFLSHERGGRRWFG